MSLTTHFFSITSKHALLAPEHLFMKIFMKVHEDIYEEFVVKTTEQALKRIVGDPFDGATMQGPQVRHLNV